MRLAAQVRAQQAKLSHDPDEFERALEEVKRADERIKDSPIVLDTKLFILMHLIELLEDESIDTKELREQADQTVAIMSRSDMLVSPNSVATYEFSFGDKDVCAEKARATS